jgi:hypothetical protein
MTCIMLNACWKLDLLQCNRADGACSDPQKKLLASLKLVTGVILFEKGNNFFFWNFGKKIKMVLPLSPCYNITYQVQINLSVQLCVTP